jgi:predicted nucleic acid-binding protein
VSYSAATIVLSDASALIAFSRSGAANALLEYLGNRLIVVRDVLNELQQNRAKFAALHVFIDWLEADEETRVLDLTPENILNVGDVLRLLQLPGDPRFKHVGEVATIQGALQLRDAGRTFLICMDDQDGKKLARSASFQFADTPALIIEMVCSGAIPVKLGQTVWQNGAFPDRRELWKEFATRIRNECPGRLSKEKG